MTLCYLALGSNLKTPERQLRAAIHKLRSLPNSYLLKVAPFYKNPAQGRRSQPIFYNTVVLINTRLTPKDLLKACQHIEHQQGRSRRVKNEARSLDIDILLYGSRKIKTPTLKVPHPQMFLRDFVMIPLWPIYPHVNASEIPRCTRDEVDPRDDVDLLYSLPYNPSRKKCIKTSCLPVT